MPFDYDEYQKKCDGLTIEQLHAEYENYTRQLAGGATSTATSVLFSPFTAGISLVGLGLAAPRVHNARKKREIIEAGLQARGATHHTRKRDVIAPMAVAGTLGTLTLGLAGPGADMIAGEVVGHGVEYAASHVVLDATGAIVEHKHDSRTHKKAQQKLQTQYQTFQPQGAVQSQVSLNETGPQTSLPLSSKPPSSSQADRPPAYQNQPQEPKYEFVPIPPPLYTPTPYQPASHQQSLSQAAGDTQKPVYQPAIYIPAQQPPSSFSPVSMLNESSAFSGGGTNVPGFQNASSVSNAEKPCSPSQVQATTISQVQSQPTSDTPGPKSDGSLHVNVYELDSDGVADTVEEAISPQLTMEKEIAFLKAKILEMEIEKRERAKVATLPASQDHQPSTETSPNPSDMSQVQLGPFEPELCITPALPSLVEHQNFPPPPSSPAPAAVATPSTPSPQYPSNDHSLYPAPLRPRPQSAHIPEYQYQPPSSPAPSVISPTTPSLQYSSNDSATASSYFALPPPPRPHSAYIPEYQYQTPTSLAPGVAAPVSHPLQSSENQSPTSHHYPPPPPGPPPRPHSVHIPEYQFPPPDSFASSNSNLQQQTHPAPPLPLRPTQQPQVQRQDSGYYSNPPSRHSSTFSTATISSCSSPPSMLSPQSTGYSMLSPQTTGHSLRHSVSHSSIPSLPLQQYFPPPPPSPNSSASPLSQVKDYFNRSFVRPSPQIPAYQPGISQAMQAPQPQFQGSQGWQWGTAPVKANGEPIYGPPPAIPQAWKGA